MPRRLAPSEREALSLILWGEGIGSRVGCTPLPEVKREENKSPCPN